MGKVTDLNEYRKVKQKDLPFRSQFDKMRDFLVDIIARTDPGLVAYKDTPENMEVFNKSATSMYAENNHKLEVLFNVIINGDVSKISYETIDSCFHEFERAFAVMSVNDLLKPGNYKPRE